MLKKFILFVSIIIILQLFQLFFFRHLPVALVNNQSGPLNINVSQIVATAAAVLCMTILIVIGLLSNLKYSFALIIISAAGASNILDRIFYGGVLDYISVGRFPTFNLADIIISVGSAWVIYILFTDLRQHQSHH